MKEKDTSGTQGVATGVEEYKLNLSIGLQLRTLLQKRGFKVVMTRTNSKVALSCIDRAKWQIRQTRMRISVSMPMEVILPLSVEH